MAASQGHGDSWRGFGARWPVAPFVIAAIVAAVISIEAATRCTSGGDAAAFFAAAAAGVFAAAAAAGALQRRWRSLVVSSVVTVIVGSAAGGMVWVLAGATGFSHCFTVFGDGDPVEPHRVHAPTWSPDGRATRVRGELGGEPRGVRRQRSGRRN